MRYLLLIMLPLFSLLAGCETQLFGMPEKQFHSLSPAEQQQVISSYNQQQVIRAQNEPINNLISTTGDAINTMNNNKPHDHASDQPSFRIIHEN